MKPNPFIPVNSSDTSSVILTSDQPPKRPVLTRTGKTEKLPRLSTRQIKRESDEDSSSSSPRESSVSSSHTNPRSSRQTEKKTVIDLNQLAAIYRNGKAEDQFKYGQMYEEGNGVDRDYTKAVDWYQRAADQNHPEAQFKLGVMYANGLGVEQNVDRALSWLIEAATQGHVKAENIYDSLAISGDLKSNTNLVEVFKWYQKAADQDQPEAQFKLGMMYYKGNGVPQDLSKAALLKS